MAVLDSSSKSPTEHWDEAGHTVGLQSVKVLPSPTGSVLQLFHKLESKLDAMQEKLQHMEKQVAVLAVPRIRDLSAQILLLAAQQQFTTSTCAYFTALSPSDPRTASLAASLDVPVEKLGPQLNGIVTRRIGQTHPGRLASLQQEVAEVAALLTPETRQIAHWECRIIDAFEAIKLAFPAGFQ